jgi:mRNA interferase MazF
VKRGEVLAANLNPNGGAEVGKVRPDAAPLRVSLPARGDLREESQVMVDQPRTVDEQRFGDGPLTTLTTDEMTRVEPSLRFLTGLA